MMSNQTKAMSCIRTVCLVVAIFALSAQAISAGRQRSEKSRFETYDRYDRAMVESRPSISRVGFGGYPVSSNELSGHGGRGSPVGGSYLSYQPRPESYSVAPQAESSSLVSGLLVTRLASDMARLSQHALRSKETKIPVYVAVAESDEEGVPSTKSLPRLIHLMDASSSQKREPTIVPAVLGSDEEVEDQLPEFLEKFRQYQQSGLGEDKTKSPIPIGGYGPPVPTSSEEDHSKETSAEGRPNIFQTPTLPETGRGPTNPDQAAAGSQSLSRVPGQAISGKSGSGSVDMMEKIQALLERQQEQLFRQHIESMVKDQLQQLVKQQISLIAKEQLVDGKPVDGPHRGPGPMAMSSSSSSPNVQAQTQNSPYGPSLKTLMEKMAGGQEPSASPAAPTLGGSNSAANIELERHMEVLTQLVKQHMDQLTKTGSAGSLAATTSNQKNHAHDHGHDHGSESRPEGQLVLPSAKDFAAAAGLDVPDRVDQQVPVAPVPALWAPSTTRRIFYDDEHGDIRRMVMPFDEHSDAQREMLKNLRQQLYHTRRQRDVDHLDPRVDEQYAPSASTTVPVLVMPPQEGYSQPRLALLAPMPTEQSEQ